MQDERICPLSAEDRKKYCLCETCQFVKRCLEDIGKTIDNIETNKKEE